MFSLSPKPSQFKLIPPPSVNPFIYHLRAKQLFSKDTERNSMKSVRASTVATVLEEYPTARL